MNECEIYYESYIGALVQKTINPNIYPKSENSDCTITYQINPQYWLTELTKANIVQYYITIDNQYLYLCKVIK